MGSIEGARTVTTTISAAELRLMLLCRQEVALIDLREEAPFATGHPLFAAQMSVGRIEVEALDRIPRRDAPIVLYDDGEGLVEPGAARLTELGYSNISSLEGGLAGWTEAGFELFQDVNSYSKAFGELLECRRRTPSLSALDVHDLIAVKANVKILDVRRFDEYATASVPSAISVPGAELVLRARAAAPDPDTTIIVHCGGRTRSIIGTQSLINAGVPNQVFALRNGTIGWSLAGQQLARNQARGAPVVTGERLIEARTRAREVAYRAGVRHISLTEAKILIEDKLRTCYRFDVRLADEYCAGHLPAFRNVPGGQLVQEIDHFAPVRGARVLLTEPLGARADMTGSWLAQMGWDVFVLDTPVTQDLELGPWAPSLPRLPEVQRIDAKQLAAAISAGNAHVIDIAPSTQHRVGHIPGARFALRSRLADAFAMLPNDGAEIIITCSDGALASFAAADFSYLDSVRALAGGTDAWVASGGALENGIESPLTELTDVYNRPYVGINHAKSAMQAYLDWEAGLVDQLSRDGTHGFFVI